MITEVVMNPFWVFMNEATKVFLKRVKDVCIIVQIHSSAEVYEMCSVKFCDNLLVEADFLTILGVSFYVTLNAFNSIKKT